MVTNQETQETVTERTLFLNGTIAEESWFDDDVTPQLFKDELLSGSGDITVWINSPGGDCVAAAQIYNMLMDYKGNVTIKIDGIAASAASVIAMAGTKVIVSPVSMMMIHNPMTAAFGNASEMEKAIAMLDEVKESIINAYEIKTGMSRAKLSHLMDAETWMNANMAVELGFADEIMQRPYEEEEMPQAQKNTADGIDGQLMELQKELLKKANNKEAYDEIADQIFKLREQREKCTVDTAARDAQIERINDLQDYIKKQRANLAEFDETLVKRWLKQITVWEDHFTVELKSGLKIDIEG